MPTEKEIRELYDALKAKEKAQDDKIAALTQRVTKLETDLAALSRKGS